MAEPTELTKALRDARLAAATQLDAALDLSDARALRLAGIREELLPLVAQNAEARALFDLNVQQGAAPKLWIDLISAVVMEPDPKTYRLVQDRENRRDVLFETTNPREMIGFVTKYLAHRMVAHDKLQQQAAPFSMRAQLRYGMVDLVYVWATGCAFGILAVMIAAMLLGKLNF